jgi:hypothetical protein
VLAAAIPEKGPEMVTNRQSTASVVGNDGAGSNASVSARRAISAP